MPMKISILRARRLAHVALLKAERRRQQEREAEARFYSNEVSQQLLADNPDLERQGRIVQEVRSETK